MRTGFLQWLSLYRVRLRKVALFLWLYTIVLAVPYVLAIKGSPWLEVRFGSFWWIIPVATLMLLASTAPLIYLAFIRRIEAQLWRDQRRYHRTLVTASSGMIRIKEIEQLCRLIVQVVNRTVRLTHSGLFLFDPKENHYVLRAVRHRAMMPAALTVEAGDPVIEVIQQQKDLLVAEELRPDAERREPDTQARKRAEVYAWMRQLEVSLIVPSFSSDRLLGFLALGPKRSREPYSTDDIAIFSGLANQAALAIENAMVFQELRENEASMIQSEKLASLGQLASGMAHEIHNPLTIISGEAQLFLARFQGENEKVDAMLKSIIEECQRAADITRRILRFAKPAPVVTRLAELTPVDLKVTLEDSLALSGYQVQMERVQCRIELPEALPKVRANQNQIQEVLLNLILNACQAMGEQGGTLTFSAAATDARQVELKVTDTGPGIPTNKLKKIFDPFFTTKQAGTGLGLFVCQRIVQSHGGVLEVASGQGQGTCFTIRLPAWEASQMPAASTSGGGTGSG